MSNYFYTIFILFISGNFVSANNTECKGTTTHVTQGCPVKRLLTSEFDVQMAIHSNGTVDCKILSKEESAGNIKAFCQSLQNSCEQQGCTTMGNTDANMCNALPEPVIVDVVGQYNGISCPGLGGAAGGTDAIPEITMPPDDAPIVPPDSLSPILAAALICCTNYVKDLARNQTASLCSPDGGIQHCCCPTQGATSE